MNTMQLTLRHALAASAIILALALQSTAISAESRAINASDTVVGRPLEAPVNTRPLADKFWWDNNWYENGVLPEPTNHAVIQKDVVYTNPDDGTEIPAILYRPKQAGRYPAVLFQHGRRGLDELVQRLPRRMAARGFVVLAPDVYSARFIDKLPIEHLEETEGDTNAGVDYLLSQPDVSTSKACLYSHTRGGYYTLQVAVAYKRQEDKVACYVAFYPHWQDPNAAEPMQVYRYATELDHLKIPTMVVIGEYEQYQRRRSIETAVKSMKESGANVRLITYPGVGRGFDFRPEGVRTFADDLATKDSLMRSSSFIRQHLKAWNQR